MKPITFTKCPVCGATETISRLFTNERFEAKNQKLPEFTSLEKIITPIEDPRTGILSVPVILVHYDVCASCGTRYCVRAEQTIAQVNVSPQGLPGMGNTRLPWQMGRS